MADKITWADKESLVTDPTIAEINKVTDNNMNEIKNVTNTNADELAEKIVYDENDITENTGVIIEELPEGSNIPYINSEIEISSTPPNTKVWIKKSKNLFKPTLYINDETIVQANCSVTIDNDTLSVKATTDAPYFGQVTQLNNAWNGTRGYLIKVKPNTKYTLFCTNTLFTDYYITSFDSNKNSLGYSHYTNNVITITTGNTTEYIVFRFGIVSATQNTIYNTRVQVEEGETATDYESFEDKIYILNSNNEYELLNL